MQKIFLDDVREAPEGWILATTPAEVIARLKSGNVSEISLDHDLGDDEGIGTGYDVLLWIEEAMMVGNFSPPAIKIHTANVSARRRMEQAVESINGRLELKWGK